MSKRHWVGSKTAWVTLIGNIVLTLLKTIVGIRSGSLVVLSDAAHSGSDSLSTILVLWGFHISRQPADEKHPYGHSRAETVVGKIIALMLILIGVNFAVSALKTIIQGNYRTPGIGALWVSLLSIAAKEAMYHYAYRVGKRISSPALIADAWHHRSDAVSSVAALLGVGLARLGYPVFDPLMTIAIAAILIKVGWNLTFSIIDELMDAQTDPKTLESLEAIVLSTEGIRSLPDLKVRKYGAEHHVDCTITVDAELTVAAGHDLSHLVAEKIRREFPTVTEVDIHVEPHHQGEKM